MTLSDWANIAEILGGIAIIASLIFVGLEVRENSRAVRSATFQAITNSDLEVVSKLVDSPELAIAYLTFSEDPSALTSAQSLSVETWLIMYMRQMENVYRQYQAGVVSQARWISARDVLDGFVTSQGGACWIRNSASYQQATLDFKDEVLNPMFERNPWKDRELACPFQIGDSVSEF